MNIKIHCGLGDHIVMAPYIAEQSLIEEVVIPCHDHNIESVKSFYINYPNVNLINENSDIDWDIKLGHYSGEKEPKDISFIDWFYDQLEIIRENILPFCPLLSASKRIGQHIVPVEDFIFVHDDPEREFNITKLDTKLRIIRPFKEGSILRYASLIEKAKEIHVIDSSFFHLCEALPTTGKLYYHQYARPYSTDNYRFIKNWEVIK